MTLNTENRLVLNYFKQLYQRSSMKKVLDLSGQCIPFEGVKTKYYYEPQCSRLPYSNQSFDFVFNRERDFTKMFISPLTSLNELMRISKTGIIQGVSPLETLLLDRDAQYITWTEPHLNRLCVLPYYGSIPIKNKTKWLDLINFNHVYLNNFYYWSNPLEINIKTYFADEIEYYEYENILNEAIEQSAEHTRHFIELHSKPEEEKVYY